MSSTGLDGGGSSGIIKNSTRKMVMTQVIVTNPNMTSPMSTIVSGLQSGYEEGRREGRKEGRKEGSGNGSNNQEFSPDI
jgi:predicted transposase YdaD